MVHNCPFLNQACLEKIVDNNLKKGTPYGLPYFFPQNPTISNFVFNPFEISLVAEFCWSCLCGVPFLEDQSLTSMLNFILIFSTGEKKCKRVFLTERQNLKRSLEHSKNNNYICPSGFYILLFILKEHKFELKKTQFTLLSAQNHSQR